MARAPGEIAHRDLAGGERGLRVEVLLARPALRLELVQLLKVVERLQHRLAVELRPPRLGVDPGAAVAGQPLRRVHEAHVELLARHLERVAAVLGEGGAELEHVVVGLGRLEPLLLAQVPALAEVGRAHRVGDPVVLAVEVLELPRRLVDVALADRPDQLVHRAQQVLGVERRGHERIEVGEVGRAARGQRGQELGVEVAPAEGLLAHLEARELLLELGDARVLDDLDRLGLDLGVPDLQLAHLLADHRGGAAEGGGADRRAGAGQETTAGDAGRRCGRVSHGSRSFRGASVGLRTCRVRLDRRRVYAGPARCQRLRAGPPSGRW